jgi:hypothetical protein
MTSLPDFTLHARADETKGHWFGFRSLATSEGTSKEEETLIGQLGLRCSTTYPR